MVREPGEGEEKVGEAVQVNDKELWDYFVPRESDDGPLGAAADRARQVERRRLGSAGRKDEGLERGEHGAFRFAGWLEGLADDFLGERVTFPAGMTPPSKTRFEMILGVKEHEMHHRAQIMLIERMLGITPHLTRQMQERMAAMQQQTKVGA